MNLTLKEYIEKIKNKSLNPKQVFENYINKSKKLNWKLNAYISITDKYWEEKLEKNLNQTLMWAPIWVKDIILTKWIRTTCWSKMLENYIAPYSATCFEKLENSWWTLIGKTNLDEFCMWWSTENSYFWTTINPYWENRIPWWTSWWSACAVASDMCICALWTDTWWSIRQPASFCNVVWLKPTYGRVSRYWVQAMASSFDQVWTITKTVEDSKILLKEISWFDPKDSTSVQIYDFEKWDLALNQKDLKNMKICVANEYFWEWLAKSVKEKILESIERIKSLWAQVDFINIEMFKYALPTYYIIVPAEVSTNLSRFDWIRFWLSENTKDFDNIYKYYQKIRSDWFWNEAKRRIIIWSYVLSAWYYDEYYKKAQKVRKKIKMEFEKLLNDYDAIVWPVSPILPWKIWEIFDDPIANYLADIYTIIPNLCWMPAMSLPIWFINEWTEKLPVWLHIISNQWREDVLFRVWNVLEKDLNK